MTSFNVSVRTWDRLGFVGHEGFVVNARNRIEARHKALMNALNVFGVRSASVSRIDEVKQ